MFDSSYSYGSSSPLPSSASDETVISLLHTFDIIIRLNPQCRGVKPVSDPEADPAEYRVEDTIAFIPKEIWDGGVWYSASFKRLKDGCDIEIHAPGGFTSVNAWRLESKDDGRKMISINSDTQSNKVYMPFIKKFLQSSHAQQQEAFNERLRSSSTQDIEKRKSGAP